jgi:hypothetical protein
MHTRHTVKLVGRRSLGLPRPDLRFENGSFSGAFSGATVLNVGRKIYGTKMTAAGRDPAVTGAWLGHHLVA